MNNKSNSFPGCALGRQMTVEFYDCDAKILANAEQMEQLFVSAAKTAGATVISSHFHSFMPQGVSGVVVISESHFAVHAWPEHDYAAVDLFTCGENVNFDLAVRTLAAAMGSDQWVISSLIDRGIVGNNGVERVVPITEGQNFHSFQLSWKTRFEKTAARAISAAIDLYECAFSTGDPEKDIQQAVQQLVKELDLNCSGACRISRKKQNIRFIQELENGWLGGFWDAEKNAVHLDLFSECFVDPRETAELALKSFSSAYYRMQPHVRQ